MNDFLFDLKTSEQVSEFMTLNPEFFLVLSQSIKDKQLLEVFSKLTKMPIPRELSPIEKMIDQATGYQDNHDEFCLHFISFIHEFIWTRLTENVRKELKEAYAKYLASPF